MFSSVNTYLLILLDKLQFGNKSHQKRIKKKMSTILLKSMEVSRTFIITKNNEILRGNGNNMLENHDSCSMSDFPKAEKMNTPGDITICKTTLSDAGRGPAQ